MLVPGLISLDSALILHRPHQIPRRAAALDHHQRPRFQVLQELLQAGRSNMWDLVEMEKEGADLKRLTTGGRKLLQLLLMEI